jgi:ferredoxin
MYHKEDDPLKSAIRIVPIGDRDFKIAVCNQCQTCVSHCPTGALTINKFGVVILNKKLCDNCYACVEACPTGDFIKIQDGEPPFKCIVCGACVRECPADALVVVDK